MSDRERRLLLIAIAVGGFSGAFAVSATNVALPSIQADFHLSAATLSWIPLSYVLTAAALLMPMGRVGDLWGHARTFTWGLRAFTIIMLATAFAPSASSLIVLRAAQGMTSAAVITTSTVLVTLAWPQEKRGRALGAFAAGPYLGMTLGPVLGGVAVYNTGWRSLFLAAGLVSAANCLVPVRGQADGHWRVRPESTFDWFGAALYAAGLPAFLLGFTLLPGAPGIGLMIFGALGLAGFFLWETRAADPLFDAVLFRKNRLLAASNAAAGSNYAATAAVILLMSLYLQYTRGLDPQTAGLVLLSGAFVQAVFSPLAGRVADWIDPYLVACGGMALCLFGLLGLAFVGSSTHYGYVIAMTCILGLGFAFFASPITHVVMGSVQNHDVGMASSTLASVRWAGSNLSLALAGLVLATVLGSQTITASMYPRVLTAVRLDLYILVGLCALGLAVLIAGARWHGASRSPRSKRSGPPAPPPGG